MQIELESVKLEMDKIRRSGRYPHWRLVYGESLFTRAQEYLMVDREPEAKRVIEKIKIWIQSHPVKEKSQNENSGTSFNFWNEEILKNTIANFQATLQKKGMLVPATERESFNRRLKILEKKLEENDFDAVHEELLSLRAALISRLRRSLRARVISQKSYSAGNLVQPEGTIIGPYNARHTLEETFHIVGERDPIWVEDFLEIYNELFRVVERISSFEKKV